MELGYGQTKCSRGVCESALKPHCAWKGPWQKYGQDFQPDLGNPAVRNDRGASGNVNQGGIVNPPRNRKSEDGNPPPTVGAPEFYPSGVIVDITIYERSTLND